MFQSSTTDRSGAVAGRQGEPVKPKKKWWSVLKVIAIIILAKILIIITLANYFSNRELSVDGGCFAGLDEERRHDATEWWQVIEWWRVIYLALPLPDLDWRPWEWPNPIEQFCSWRASFKDDPKHIFNVWLDDNHSNRSLQDNYNEVKSGKVSSED